MTARAPRWTWALAVVVAVAGLAVVALRPTAPVVPDVEGAVAATTVSYTHLTLPTIYSV